MTRIDRAREFAGAFTGANAFQMMADFAAAEVREERKRIAAELRKFDNTLDSYDQWDAAIRGLIEKLEAE